jgi:hypothetical protein
MLRTELMVLGHLAAIVALVYIADQSRSIPETAQLTVST